MKCLIANIIPDPRNPRPRLDEKHDPDLVDLAKSMADVGLLQPVLVGTPDDAGKYPLLAGHRRLAAAKLNGWAEIEAHVHEQEIEQLDVALAENLCRKDLDPFTAADRVREALAREGMTHEKLAARIGRNVKWVARRANLCRLSAPARKKLEENKWTRSWPPAWLEELALLDPAQQERLVDDHHLDDVVSIEDLRAVIRENLCTLKHAPWELDDAGLIAAVGACSACPKTTAALAHGTDLFGEYSGDGAEQQSAACTDRRCYVAKMAEHMRGVIAAARAEHGSALVVGRAHGEWGPQGRVDTLECEAVELISGAVARNGGRKRKAASTSASTEPVPVLEGWGRRAKEKGGRPCLLLSGKGRSMKVQWLSPDVRAARNGTGGPNAKGKTLSLKEKVARLERRRVAKLATLVGALVEQAQPGEVLSSPTVAVRLVAAYGTHPLETWQIERRVPRPARLAWEWEASRDEIFGALRERWRSTVAWAERDREPRARAELQALHGALGYMPQAWSDLVVEVERTIKPSAALQADIDAAAKRGKSKAPGSLPKKKKATKKKLRRKAVNA